MPNKIDLGSAINAIGAQPAQRAVVPFSGYRAAMFYVDGTLTGCTASLQAQNQAGNWADVPNSAITTGPGLAEVTVPGAGQYRLMLTGGSCAGVSAVVVTP